MRILSIILAQFLILSLSTASSESLDFSRLDEPLSPEEQHQLEEYRRIPYDFFQKGKENPFLFNTKSFQALNAYWLADASALAYRKPKEQIKFLKLAGFQFKLFEGKKHDTQAYIAHTEDFILTVFRGTEPLNPMDWFTDLKYKLVPSGQGGKVHFGFKQALDEVWPEMLSYLVQLQKEKKRRIFFTGHSLGSALSILASDRWGYGAVLYSFGSPRVGDRDFYRDFKPTGYRVVNHLDIITHIPPHKSFLGNFYHVGTTFQMDRDGIFKEGSLIHSKKLMELIGWPDKLKKIRILRLFFDHIPYFYSFNSWKNYELENEVDSPEHRLPDF